MNTNSLPDNNTNINIKTHLLDPLSVIIKLAIIGNKPVGTKILIQNNTLYLQEPGPFQALCRLIYNTNKTDLQFMYNPIQLACSTFLTKESVQKNARLKSLFICAQVGLKKLMETYKNCSIICLCLNYYYAIITNHVEQKFNDDIFYKDEHTCFYTKQTVEELTKQWSQDKIKVILDLISFLNIDSMPNDNVKSIETIMINIDKNTQQIINNI